jgi:tRNA G18 (ribose-2'-O)-methylase SpoU
MTDREVGVGPWSGEVPDDDRLDPVLLAEGDRRNVVDRYRYWRHDAIVADLDSRRHPLHVAVENLQHDFNIGSVVRTANAFNVAGVHIVGRRRWNRRGAMMTETYVRRHHHGDVDAFASWSAEAGLPVVGVDNVAGAEPIEATRLPPACVLVFGQEGPGLSPGLREVCGTVLAITQYGSTRSINAGAAAAIAMHTWIRQHADPSR